MSHSTVPALPLTGSGASVKCNACFLRKKELNGITYVSHVAQCLADRRTQTQKYLLQRCNKRTGYFLKILHQHLLSGVYVSSAAFLYFDKLLKKGNCFKTSTQFGLIAFPRDVNTSRVEFHSSSIIRACGAVLLLEGKHYMLMN